MLNTAVCTFKKKIIKVNAKGLHNCHIKLSAVQCPILCMINQFFSLSIKKQVSKKALNIFVTLSAVRSFLYMKKKHQSNALLYYTYLKKEEKTKLGKKKALLSLLGVYICWARSVQCPFLCTTTKSGRVSVCSRWIRLPFGSRRFALSCANSSCQRTM